MTPTSRFVDLRGRGSNGRTSLRFHYRDWGGDGQPLVLLHGLASNSRIWDLTAPLLRRRFRVLALDQRGHGLSDKPDDGYDFQSVAGDLLALLQALALDQPMLVGHSWGANVALQFAADRPDAVSRLVLVDGGFLELSAFEGMTWERAREMLSPPPLDGLKLSTFVQNARDWPGLKEVWSDDVEKIVLANFRVDEGDSIHPHLSRENHLKILRSLWEQKPSTLWASVHCPVLLIPAASESPDQRNLVWMEHKRKGIELAEQRAPEVGVVWMEETIHDVPLQRPQELADAIDGFVGEVA